MLRWFGAGLILCASLMTRFSLVESERAAQRLRLALAAAFESMEAEVRFMLSPIPSLLGRDYGEANTYFTQVKNRLSEDFDLWDAWTEAASGLPLSKYERTIISQMGWRMGKDEEAVCAALTFGANGLRRIYEQAERTRQQKERLITSICLSVSLLLALLLL